MFVITFSEVLGLMLFVFVLVIVIVASIKTAAKQFLCSHDAGVNETQACDAICRKCGANLGFIGTWRKQQAKKKGGTQ